MKKSFVLILALVFTLGIASTTFANPFTDVPANHWAYASISKLAQTGIIDGYGDGRFIGNSNMTRYEMAQIVAKAMANSDKADAATKAQIEKLAAEFSAELNALGLRIASLEKKADNVQITGEARFTYYGYGDKKYDDGSSDKNAAIFNLRTLLWLTGNVNDNWKYTAMLENYQKLTTNAQDTNTYVPRAGTHLESAVLFSRAYVEGKIGVIGVTAGRFHYRSLYGTVLDFFTDGLSLNYTNNKLSVDAFALRPHSLNGWYWAGNFSKNLQVYGTQINYNFDKKWHAGATYFDLQGKGEGNSTYAQFGKTNTSIFELGLDYKFDDKFWAWANYIRGGKVNQAFASATGADFGSRNGWATGVTYGNSDRNKAGSYQLRASYYDVASTGTIATTVEHSDIFATNTFGGFKGYTIGGSYMVAKNIDVNVDFYDFKSNASEATTGKVKQNLLWSYIRFYF